MQSFHQHEDALLALWALFQLGEGMKNEPVARVPRGMDRDQGRLFGDCVTRKNSVKLVDMMLKQGCWPLKKTYADNFA